MLRKLDEDMQLMQTNWRCKLLTLIQFQMSPWKKSPCVFSLRRPNSQRLDSNSTNETGEPRITVNILVAGLSNMLHTCISQACSITKNSREYFSLGLYRTLFVNTHHCYRMPFSRMGSDILPTPISTPIQGSPSSCPNQFV